MRIRENFLAQDHEAMSDMRSSPSGDSPGGHSERNRRSPTIYNVSNADSNDHRNKMIRLGGNKKNIRALKNIKPYFVNNKIVKKIKAQEEKRAMSISSRN